MKRHTPAAPRHLGRRAAGSGPRSIRNSYLIRRTSSSSPSSATAWIGLRWRVSRLPVRGLFLESGKTRERTRRLKLSGLLASNYWSVGGCCG